MYLDNSELKNNKSQREKIRIEELLLLSFISTALSDLYR